MRKQNPRLSESQVDALIEAYRQGTPMKKIADRFGITETGVNYHLVKRQEPRKFLGRNHFETIAAFHKDPTDPRHGTLNGYNNLRCRCDECTLANTESVRQLREERSKREVPPEIHGKATTYANWVCRCDACTAAHAVERRKYNS